MEKIQGEFLVVVVANSPQYGFGCTVAPDANLSNGRFDVICLPRMSPITFFRNLTSLFSKKPLLDARF